jgi:hypothetical protein
VKRNMTSLVVYECSSPTTDFDSETQSNETEESFGSLF